MHFLFLKKNSLSKLTIGTFLNPSMTIMVKLIMNLSYELFINRFITVALVVWTKGNLLCKVPWKKEL